MKTVSNDFSPVYAQREYPTSSGEYPPQMLPPLALCRTQYPRLLNCDPIYLLDNYLTTHIIPTSTFS